MLINSKLQHLPQATHRHLTVVRARGGNLNIALVGWGFELARICMFSILNMEEF